MGGNERASAAVATALEREGDQLAVEFARGASDGSERLSNGDFDCVVSEYALPQGDGVEFLEAVRESFPELPFVLFATEGDERVASDAIAAGVTEYVPEEGDSHGYARLTERVTAAVEDTSGAVDAECHRHRHEQILKAFPGCVVELNGEGQFIYANQRAEEVLGLEHSAVTDRTYNDPDWQIRDLSGEPIPDEELPFRQVWEREEPLYGYNHAIRWPDGTRKVLSVSGVPLFDEDGEVESVVF
ncbi:MAG: PAS domain-containing protein [Halopenitus sp.]